MKLIDNLDKEEQELYKLLAQNLTEEQFVRALQLIAIDADKYHQEQLNKTGVIHPVSTRDFEHNCEIYLDDNDEMFIFKHNSVEKYRSKSRFDCLVQKKKLQKQLGV